MFRRVSSALSSFSCLGAERYRTQFLIFGLEADQSEGHRVITRRQPPRSPLGEKSFLILSVDPIKKYLLVEEQLSISVAWCKKVKRM